MFRNELPVPPHFNPEKVGEVWKIAYEEIASNAEEWAGKYGISPAAEDRFRICLIGVDVQNSFCIPGFELYVGGRSGKGAVDDNLRLCKFIYRNLDVLTQICPTMDTHQAMQIFHAVYLVNEKGEHPAPFTIITEEDVRQGIWKFNPRLNSSFPVTEDYGQRHLLHYVMQLRKSGKYDLTVWPYHAMLGGIGHALVPAAEEAIFFHTLARCSQPHFLVKGDRPFTEHYSVLGPEVLEGPSGEPIAQKNDVFFRKMFEFDAILIAGQAKSHCVAWTIQDLLDDILTQDRRLAEKIYLMEDCTSPVVVPGMIDYTEQADAAFRRFAESGMHIVRSTDPLEQWPGIRL
ncbi:MAG: isochorismatase [Nitrospirota bacterium]